MTEFTISTDQARQFALDIFDVLIQDIKAQEAKEHEDARKDGEAA